MSTKRYRNEFGVQDHTSGCNCSSKRASISFAAVIHEVMVTKSLEKLVVMFEPIMRKAIHEEVEIVFHKLLYYLKQSSGPQQAQQQPHPQPQWQPQQPQPQPQPQSQQHDLQIIEPALCQQQPQSQSSQQHHFQPQLQPHNLQMIQPNIDSEASPMLMSPSCLSLSQPQPHDLQIIRANTGGEPSSMLLLPSSCSTLCQPQQQSQPQLRMIEAKAGREVSTTTLPSPSSHPTLPQMQSQPQPHGLPIIQPNTGGEASPSSRSTQLRLAFVTNPPKDIFTNANVRDVGGKPLQLELVGEASSDSGQLLHYSLQPDLKINLVMVDGDFPGSGKEEWTAEQFSRSVIKERDGKRPLLIGNVNDVVITDVNKRVTVEKLVITDNSSWTRSRNFRIGARVAPECCETAGVRIKEAITETFVVRDQRGELYKKSYPPVPSDQVWRLKNISKGGKFHKRLSENHIHNLQDFLKLYAVDPGRLRTIMGMAEKIWEETVNHAKTCDEAQATLLLNRVGGVECAVVGGNRYAAGDSHVNGALPTLLLNPVGGAESAVVDGNRYAARDSNVHHLIVNDEQDTQLLSPVGGIDCATITIDGNDYTAEEPHVNSFVLNSYNPWPETQHGNTAVMSDTVVQRPVNNIIMPSSYYHHAYPALVPSASNNFDFLQIDENGDFGL